MKFIKMRIVNTEEFKNAMTQLQMSLGFLCSYKRRLVWIVCFETIDAEIIRDELKEYGSEYAGTWKLA